MQLVHVDDVEWFGRVRHREKGVDFKRLLSGEDLTPNNFEFNLVKVEEHYETPRHRHNFDQVRFMLEGSFGYDRGLEQKAGSVGYFGEGTYYQQHGEGLSYTLLLQAANASRAPYMSFPTLRAKVDEMIEKKVGEFHDGVFTGFENGRKFNKDGFEAVWEYTIGRKLTYPRPRYDGAIIMNPQNFDYVDVEGQAGVRRKLLGVFTERELAIGLLSIDAGAGFTLDGSRSGEHLFYMLSGSGAIGDRAWRRGSAVHIDGTERQTLRADAGAEAYYLRLPTRVAG